MVPAVELRVTAGIVANQASHAQVSKMSEQDTILILRSALESIRVHTFAEFQFFPEPKQPFDRKKHACPLCLRASSSEYLSSKWAQIQSEAAQALRDTDGGEK